MLGYPLHLTLINHPRYVLLGRNEQGRHCDTYKDGQGLLLFLSFPYLHSPYTPTLSQFHNLDFSLTLFTLTYNHTHRKHGQRSSKQAL
jgi:hypothetical protein